MVESRPLKGTKSIEAATKTLFSKLGSVNIDAAVRARFNATQMFPFVLHIAASNRLKCRHGEGGAY